MKRLLNLVARSAVKAGLPPRVLGWRGLTTEVPEVLAQRLDGGGKSVGCRIVHPENVFANPLPLNISDRDDLPMDRGWWGYSFHDVPARPSPATVVATIPDCLVVTHLDARNEFWASIVTETGRTVALREMQFRSWQRPLLASAPRVKIPKATWLVERVFDNYSHWLTAHLPKLLLLRDLGLAEQVLLPSKRAPFIDDCLRLYGFDPTSFATFEPGTVLEVSELTVVSSDRFRPELLQGARQACPKLAEPMASRRVFISREGAQRRKLVNEADVWPMLEKAGFERIQMERLSFTEQVRLMQETQVLCAPHGAGLTNMLFCQAGTHVIEIADPAFPNPNFYATASALGLPYHIVRAESRGTSHPLEKDLYVEPQQLTAEITRLREYLPERHCETARE